MACATKYKDVFEKKHGVKLGFMGFFTKAVTHALKEMPAVNAEIDGTDIIYKNYCHIGMAVGTDKGLVVPSSATPTRCRSPEIEKDLGRLGKLARDGALSMADMQGGTFTITNGGVYGSLMSSPILNAPQSGILGMHKIQERPVVVGGQIVIRPMMYLALSYDHRIVDGKEAVTFLVRVKEDCLQGQRARSSRPARSRSPPTTARCRRSGGKNIVIATGSDAAGAAGRQVDREKHHRRPPARSRWKVPKTPDRRRRRCHRPRARLGLAPAGRQGDRGRIPRPHPRPAWTRVAKRLPAHADQAGHRPSSSAPRSPGEKAARASTLTVEPVKGGDKAETLEADVVLVAIGRKPYTAGLGLERSASTLDKRGRVEIDHFKTSAPASGRSAT
jgi:hypothetical protein